MRLTRLSDNSSIPSAPPPPSILIVDDDSVINRLLQRVLRAEGFHTEHATSAREAIEVIEARLIHAVVLDVGLGAGPSGIDFLAWIRAEETYSRLPVLIWTARTELPEDEESIIRRDRAYVFYKPRHHELLAYLKRLTAIDGC